MRHRLHIPLLILMSALALGSCKHTSFEEQAVREMRQQTAKICPSPVQGAQGLMFDSIYFRPEINALCHYYLMDDSIYTPDIIRECRDDFAKLMADQVRASLDMKRFKDRDVTFRFTYYYKDGAPVMDIRVTPKDYR